VSDSLETPGQSELSEAELSRVAVGNQYTDEPTPIEYRVIKGAAVYYGVTDWTAHIDTSLTLSENVAIMSRVGTRNNESTMRELSHKIDPDPYRRGGVRD